MAEHILDRSVWTSLTSIHAGISVVSGGARRFESDISLLPPRVMKAPKAWPIWRPLFLTMAKS